MSPETTTIAALRRELSEANELVRAIRAGEVDAFVLGEPDSYRVHALQDADTPYRVLVEAMRQGAATVSSDGIVLYANRRLREMLGVEQHEIVGQTITRCLGLDPSALGPLLTETLGNETRQEITFRRGDVVVPALLSVYALPDHHPDATFCLVITDVSERRAIEEREAHVARERASLAAIFSRLPFAVFVADAEGQFHYVNEAGETILEIGGDVRDQLQQCARLALGNAPSEPKEIALQRPDGTTKHYVLHWNAVRIPGHPERAVVVAADVTPDREARSQREREDQFREMFVGILGHDLRSPLQVILTSASLLKRRATSSEDQKFAESIVRAAHRMNRLTEDMLDMTLSRLGGGVPIKRTSCDLGDIVASTIDDLGAEHASRFLVEVEGNTTSNWDRARLCQVVSNLLRNALNYGAASQPIRIGIHGDGPTSVRLDVHNDGKPIPAELLPVIFDPFRRGGDLLQRRGEGVGLGLFIAEQIVLSHGGTISVRSSTEEGTTFSVCLPRGDE